MTREQRERVRQLGIGMVYDDAAALRAVLQDAEEADRLRAALREIEALTVTAVQGGYLHSTEWARVGAIAHEALALISKGGPAEEDSKP